MKTIVSFSGGKDSTAMLLRMLELDYKIDEIVFADTLFEFPELYEYIKRVEKYIGRKITILKPDPNLFKEWFYGKVTRGDNKDKIRGFPLRAFPCWWTRESKIKPLSKFQKDIDKVYIGIAFDEQKRMSKVDDKLYYPLVDWKWTEQDCIDYLNKKNMFNPLYVNFDRLGCWHCPKQGGKSLYVLWKNYPKLWREFLWWDKETYNKTGHWIKEKPLSEIQKEFESGKIPKKLPKYECWNGCESVKKAFQDRQCGLGLFIEEEKLNSEKVEIELDITLKSPLTKELEGGKE